MSATPTSWPPPPVRRSDGSGAEGTWVSPGYRPSGLRGTVAIALIGAAVAANAVGLLLALRGLGLLDAAEAGTLTDNAAIAFDDLNSKVGLLGLALYLASAVAFVAWLSRVVENLPPLTGHTPRRSPREAVGWWFVPFANWWVPYQIVADAVRRLRSNDGDRSVSLLAPWWAMWLVGIITGSVVGRLPTETIEALRAMFIVAVISDGATAVAGILLVLIVRAVERRSDARARALGLGPGAQPAWPQAAQAGLLDPMTDVPGGAVAVEIVDGDLGDAKEGAAAMPDGRP